MKKKITVITDTSGKVLGTQEGHGEVPDPRGGILLALVAAEGQRAHQIEYDVPEFHSAADLSTFHLQLAAHLKAAK
jgi:hypothetical protein